MTTKDNLFKRNVLYHNNVECVNDYGKSESVDHLMFECNFFKAWYQICSWLGITTTLQNNCKAHLDQFEELKGWRKSYVLRMKVIWSACVWKIWKSRNEKIFRNINVCIDKMVEEVKQKSWKWL